MASHPTLPLWPGETPGLETASPTFVPTITPYPLADDRRHGAVVVLPGGGYVGRAPHESAPIAEWLNRAGIAAFVCDYRVAPYRHPYPSLDAKRAIRWVRQHADTYGVDRAKVGLLGFSAGGHCAATVGTQFDPGQAAAVDPVERWSCRPDALVLCYAVLTFGEHGHAGCCHNLLGPDPPDDLRRALSSDTRVTAETPPTFLWHTADDGGVPVENSLLFAAALSRHKVPFALHVFAHGRHGLGLAEEEPEVARWTDLCAAWLSERGFAADGPRES